MTTELKTGIEKATEATVSIPAARLPTPADAIPAEQTPTKVSLKDRLKGMKAAPTAKKPPASKRPEYEAPREAVEALSRFIPASLIRKIAEKRAENADAEVSEIMMAAFCEALWRNKVVPANPKIIVKDGDVADMSAIFQVQDRFTANNMAIPPVKPDAEEEDVVEAVVAALTDAGLEEADARRLVEAEINCQKRRGIRTLNELIDGHFGADKQWVDATPQEQKVAEKLMDFLESLSEEEQAIIRRDEVKVQVKKDFLTRVPQYAHCAAQVQAILKIFAPVHFVSHAEIGLQDDEATKVKRLQQAAGEMIGSAEIK